MPVFFEGQITGPQVIPNMPQGQVVFIQTDLELSIEWWDTISNNFNTPPETIVAPGDEVSCPSFKARITPTLGTANIRVVAGR